MTATVIPFPSKSVREAVLEARKDAEVVRRYTKQLDGWLWMPALANAEQCVLLALKRTDVQPLPRKIWPGGVVSGGGRYGARRPADTPTHNQPRTHKPEGSLGRRSPLQSTPIDANDAVQGP
jgi:hypothetical protein